MKYKVGDEVFIVRGYGVENDPPFMGVIHRVDPERWGELAYMVEGSHGNLWRCSESWLIPVHLLIREAPSLADA